MRIFKFFGKCFISLILLLLIFWIIILAALQTNQGQEWVFNRVVSYLENSTQTQIQIKKIQFSFPLDLSLEDVVLMQENRPVLKIQNFKLCCAYLELLKGRIVFSNLQAFHVELLEGFDGMQSSKKQTFSLEIPHFPFYVKIQNIDVQQLRLPSSLVRSLQLPDELREAIVHSSFNLNGSMRHNPFKSAFAAHLFMTARGGEIADLTPFSLELDAQNHQFSLSFHFHALPLQWLRSDLPAHLKAHFALYASAPISAWQKLADNTATDQELIEGHFKLVLNPDSKDLALFNSETVLRSHYSIKSKNAIEFMHVKIAHPHFFLNGEATLNWDGVIEKSVFQGQIQDLEVFKDWMGQDIQGQVAFSGNAKGSLQSTLLNIEVKSPHVVVAQQRLENIHTIFQTSLQFPILKGFFNLSFDSRGIPFTTFSSFDWNERKELALSHLQIDTLDTHFQGAVKYLSRDSIWEGGMEARHANFKEFSELFGTLIHGTGDVKFEFVSVTGDHDQKKQGLRAELVGKTLKGTDWQVDQMTLYVNSDSLKEDQSILSPLQVSFKGQNIKWKSYVLEELMGSTSFDFSQFTSSFYIKGKMAWKEDVLFVLDGHWHYRKDFFELEGEHLKGRIGPYSLGLKHPLRFTMRPNEVSLAGLWLQWGEAEIQADFSQNLQMVSGQFKTNAVPSELFFFFAPNLPLAGRATLQGHFEGPAHEPTGQFQINLHNIQITEDLFAQKPFINGKLLLDLHPGKLELTSELKGIGQTPLVIGGHLPVNFSVEPFNFQFNSDLPFHLTLNAEGELAPYLHLFYHDAAHLSGHAKIALQLNGQINAPEVRGHIDLMNGAYESLNTGALYHNIQARLEGNGSKIALTKFSAEDNKKGLISATGIVDLNAAEEFPFEFLIHPSRVFIVDSDYVDMSASGQLTLTGNTKKSKLQGELSVDQANVHLEATFPRKPKNIEIKYMNLAPGESISNYSEKKEMSFVELDVKLHASRSVRIQDDRLKSEWKGSLVVNGTLDNPEFYGDLRVSEGQYDFNGKVFNLSQGNIHFAGPLDKKTTLYVIASKEIDRITAEIIVKGPVKKPVVSFRSNPPLSQREVLSYILFNRGISDITPDQGDQLSQSFMSLSREETKGGNDFLSRLRNNGIIDHLDFTSGGHKQAGMDHLEHKDNPEFGLQVGKNITENLKVTVKQDVTTSLSPIIAVEAKLRKNLKAEAEAGVVEDAPIRMSIKWKKDY